MPTKMYKEARTCVCGYSTYNPGNWCVHKKTCKTLLKQPLPEAELLLVLREELATKNEQLSVKDEQLSAKDQHYQKELAAKDRQIEELIKVTKKPRTVTNNNRYVVEQQINVFGKESLAHITPEQIQGILSDPENAVARFVKLKHRKEPSNSNVRCPNVNRAIYQVVVGGEGEEKEWENRAKGEVLEKLYDDNSCLLECEATEEDNTPFLDHQDKIKASIEGSDGGRKYKQQLDKIHNVIVT